MRVLRAVILSPNRRWDPFSTLDVVDERSLIRLLDRGGVGEISRSGKAPTVTEYLKRQRYIDNPELVQAVSRHLNGKGG
jgi:hypothetical protein